MKNTLTLTFIIVGVRLLSQETVSQFEKIDLETEVEKIKNIDLKLIKEIHRNPEGKIVKYFNFNPTSGALQGEFYNGLYYGTIKNNLVTTNKCLVIFAQSSQHSFLVIEGPIKSGIFDGKYTVWQRVYNDNGKAIEIHNSYAQGEYSRKNLEAFTNLPHTQKIVGEIIFENGVYSSYNFEFDNKLYRGEFAHGFLDYFLIKDLATNRNIDSMKVNGKVYVKNGKYQKNKSSRYRDYREDDELETGYSLVDTLQKFKKAIGEISTNIIRFRDNEYQPFPIVDPLAKRFEISSIALVKPILNITFIETNGQYINVVPTSSEFQLPASLTLKNYLDYYSG